MYSNISLKQFCSATSNIPPLCKSFANVWRHFCLLQFGGERAAMAKDIVNTPTKHRVMIPQQRTNLPKMLNGTEVELKYKNYQHTPNKHLACILCKLYFREKKNRSHIFLCMARSKVLVMLNLNSGMGLWQHCPWLALMVPFQRMSHTTESFSHSTKQQPFRNLSLTHPRICISSWSLQCENFIYIWMWLSQSTLVTMSSLSSQCEHFICVWIWTHTNNEPSVKGE